MVRVGTQQRLFDISPELPAGLIYKPDFITPEEEAEILSYIEDLPLEENQYGEYLSKRRSLNLGWDYDFENKKFIQGPPLPPFLRPVQIRIAKWLDIPPRNIVEALINEYTTGSALGWHRDNEGFEHVIGLSLAGWARMRFRPLKPRNEKKSAKDVVALELEPRSLYLMQNDIRWNWQHSVAKTKELRYSITFRTLPCNT